MNIKLIATTRDSTKSLPESTTNTDYHKSSPTEDDAGDGLIV